MMMSRARHFGNFFSYGDHELEKKEEKRKGKRERKKREKEARKKEKETIFILHRLGTAAVDEER